MADYRKELEDISESGDAFATAPQFMPLSIARMVWKKRSLAAVVWIAVSAVAAVVIAKLPSVYEAEAVILVDSQKIPEKFVASTVEITLQDSLNAISQQVLSSGVLEHVLDRYNLYPELRGRRSKAELLDKLRRDLQITTERGLSLGRPTAFRIAYDAPQAKVAAGVVNDVANSFVTQNVKTREQRAEGTSEFIESQLVQAKKSLDEQEVQLSEFKQKWAGELPQQEAALSSALARMETELQGNQEASARAQQNKLVLENTLRFSESTLASLQRSLSAPSTRIVTANGVTALRNSERLRAKLDELKLRYTNDHPEVKEARTQLEQALSDEAKADAIASKAAKTGEVQPTSDPAIAQLHAEIERQKERVAGTRTQLQVVEQELATRAKERQSIMQEIASYQSRVEKLPIREQQMASLTRDYENTKANYRSLLDKKISAGMATEMEKSQQSERFTIAEPAQVPAVPVKPKRPVLFAIASLAGLVLGLALGIGIELRKDLFLGEWELPQEITVLGRISVSSPNIQGASSHV